MLYSEIKITMKLMQKKKKKTITFSVLYQNFLTHEWRNEAVQIMTYFGICKNGNLRNGRNKKNWATVLFWKECGLFFILCWEWFIKTLQFFDRDSSSRNMMMMKMKNMRRYEVLDKVQVTLSLRILTHLNIPM